MKQKGTQLIRIPTGTFMALRLMAKQRGLSIGKMVTQLLAAEWYLRKMQDAIEDKAIQEIIK
jgi:hypothetical protein